MAKTDNNKLGINPRLISQITGRDLAEIPVKPDISMLPGSYARKVARRINKIAMEFPENKHYLTCTICGHTARYNLGSVFFEPGAVFKDKVFDSDTSWLTNIQATGYFRCINCNSAGAWELAQKGSHSFIFGMFAGLMNNYADINGGSFQIGVIQLADGSRPRWSTDSEEYYLKKLADHPQDGYLWNRLGNCYYKGGRPDLAAAAFEQSVKVDPGQLESHFSLGRFLFEIDLDAEAVQHLRQVLILAHSYEKLPAPALRDMLTETLRMLVMISQDEEEFLSFLPTAEEVYLREDKPVLHNPVIKIMDISIDSSDPLTLRPLAECYMGKRRRELNPGTGKSPQTKIKKKKKRKR